MLNFDGPPPEAPLFSGFHLVSPSVEQWQKIEYRAESTPGTSYGSVVDRLKHPGFLVLSFRMRLTTLLIFIFKPGVVTYYY